MSPVLKTLAEWPRRKNSKPLLNDTGEALYFAQLIWRDDQEQKMLQFFRDDCYAKLRHVRQQKHPDLDLMFALAVEAQFYRECLEECTRISNEPYTAIVEASPPEGA